MQKKHEKVWFAYQNYNPGNKHLVDTHVSASFDWDVPHDLQTFLQKSISPKAFENRIGMSQAIGFPTNLYSLCNPFFTESRTSLAIPNFHLNRSPRIGHRTHIEVYDFLLKRSVDFLKNLSLQPTQSTGVPKSGDKPTIFPLKCGGCGGFPPEAKRPNGCLRGAPASGGAMYCDTQELRRSRKGPMMMRQKRYTLIFAKKIIVTFHGAAPSFIANMMITQGVSGNQI